MSGAKIRVAVAINEEGQWLACGYPDDDDQAIDEVVSGVMEEGGQQLATYWLTATVPIPETDEVEAEVETAK